MTCSGVVLLFWAGLCCVLCEPSASVQLRPSCSYEAAPNSDLFIVRCSFLGLDTLPKQIFNETIAELDISGNNFKSLGTSSFSGLPSMKKLNISECGIKHLSSDTFEGLVSLRELDLKNNPVLSRGLPDKLFDHLPQLERLYVSGNVISTNAMSSWGNLSSLRTIALTPGQNDNFSQLTRLPNLTSVYFTFCQFDGYLKQSMLKAFRNSAIRELAFVGCYLEDIENGTFDGLLSLDVLNMAGNDWLSIDRVIDVLSTSGANVSTLILDCVGSKNNIFLAGRREEPSCRRAWTSVKCLSIRGINLVALLEPMKRCLPNLQVLTGGFNTVSKCGRGTPSCMSLLFEMGTRLQHLDLSYSMLSDTVGLGTLSGYRGRSNWIKLNDDYFPSATLSKDCHPRTNIFSKSDSYTHSLSLLPCLSYIKCDHLFINIFDGNLSGPKQLSFRNLKYLNISSRYSVSDKPIILDVGLQGLEKLSVLDASGFGILFINSNFFHSLTSLELLDLSQNQLGKGNFQVFPRMTKLKDLNLADNYFVSFPHDSFVNLISLHRLDLSGNHLTELRFALPSTLEHLDVSKNWLTLLGPDDRLLLDQHRRLLFTMDDNPLQCDCPETTFIKWYQQGARQISNWQRLTCTKGTTTYRITEINVERLQLACELTVNKVVLISSMCALALIITTIFLVAYRYRWLIRWKYYQYRYRRHRRRENLLLRSLTGRSSYSCYVIFPYDDYDTRHWVETILIKEVEETLHKPAMFVKGRDDLPGASYIDEIVRGVMESKTALWIVCPAFFQDNCCELAARFAFHHLGVQNNLLVILDNHFSHYSTPNRFAAMMNPEMGLRRISFKDDDTVRRLFFTKLDDFLPSW